MTHVWVVDNDNSHLGGNVIEGDSWTYCPTVWKYVKERFGIKTALDLGSGLGYSSKWFKDNDIEVIAVDGFIFNVNNAVYPTILFDLTKTSITTKVDLVHCHEVVEHIEEKYINNLLDSLCCGKYILMTNALPGQGGWHHVNEQPTEYWTKHLEARGYEYLTEDSKRVKELAKLDGAVWMSLTGSVYINRKKFIYDR